MNPKGFTLIEVSAVILIMGLLAAGAVLSLAHTVSHHRSLSIPQLLQQADALVRSAACQSGQRQKLIFDLDDQEVWWQPNPGTERIHLIRLGSSDSVAIRTVDGEIAAGQVTIDYSTNGRSSSYALHLISSEDSQKWIMIAGLTGKTFTTNDEKQIETILQPPDVRSQQSSGLIASPSNDTD